MKVTENMIDFNKINMAVETALKPDFIKAYSKSKTWADLDNAIDKNLKPSEMVNLRSALEVVKEYVGIDMRQDFLLGILSSRIDNGLIS